VPLFNVRQQNPVSNDPAAPPSRHASGHLSPASAENAAFREAVTRADRRAAAYKARIASLESRCDAQDQSTLPPTPPQASWRAPPEQEANSPSHKPSGTPSPMTRSSMPGPAAGPERP
jgi:hypothetical protein